MQSILEFRLQQGVVEDVGGSAAMMAVLVEIDGWVFLHQHRVIAVLDSGKLFIYVRDRTHERYARWH